MSDLFWLTDAQRALLFNSGFKCTPQVKVYVVLFMGRAPTCSPTLTAREFCV